MKNNKDIRDPHEPEGHGLPLFGGSLPCRVSRSSAEAFDDIKATGVLGTQARIILKLLISLGVNLSLQEICSKTGLTINSVSGRVNELKNTSPPLIVEGPSRKCRITKRVITPVGVS